MSVSKLTEAGDWTFGNGLADYVKNSAEVAQKVYTRLRFVLNDWAFDDTQGIDWFGILGNKNTENTIRSEVIRTVVNTDGVQTIDSFSAEVNRLTRTIAIAITYTDIYEEQETLTVPITIGG